MQEGDEDGDEDPDASFARSPVGKGQEAQDAPDSDKRPVRAKIRIPQTAVFKDGVLKVWYFTQNGLIKKKMRKSLERSTLLREFIKEARPGRPVAVLICAQEGADAMHTTQTQVMDEGQFLTVVKNAFSTRMTAMIQEYIPGAESWSPMAWVKNPPHDPRTMGLGCLQVVWSPTRMDIALRGEEDLAAITHHCVQRIDRDGRLEFGRLTAVVHDMGNRRHGSQRAETPIKAHGKAFKRYPNHFDMQAGARHGAKSAEPALMRSETGGHGWDELGEPPLSRGRHDSGLGLDGGGDEGFSRAPSSTESTAPAAKSMTDLAHYHAERANPKNNKKPETPIKFPILTADDAYTGRCQVIALDERTAVKNACIAVARLMASSRTSSGEVPELKRFLAYFKRSQRGKVYMLWCSAAVLLPSESVSVRTIAQNTREYTDIKHLFQNLVLNPGWYAKFCSLEEDADQIKSFDIRASTMDFPEWLHFLRVVRMLPDRLSKQEATQIFKRANRVSGVSDADRNELTFSEWKVALSQVASVLGIDWEPVAAAACFGEMLMNPRLFKRFARLPPCSRSLSSTHMHFHQFFKLLQTYAVCPQLVSKDVAETAFRKTLREHNAHRGVTAGSPTARGSRESADMHRRTSSLINVHELNQGNAGEFLITQDGFKFALSYISEQCDIGISYPEMCIKSEYSTSLLGSDQPPPIQVDDPVNRFFSPQPKKHAAWKQGVSHESSDDNVLSEDEPGSPAGKHGGSGPILPHSQAKAKPASQSPQARLSQQRAPAGGSEAKPGARRGARKLPVRSEVLAPKVLLHPPGPEQARQKRRLLQLRQGLAGPSIAEDEEGEAGALKGSPASPGAESAG